MKADDRIIDHDLSRYNTAHVVFQPVGMSKEQLYSGYLWTYRRFYSFRNIFRRTPESYRQWKPFFLFNFLYRKFGSLTSFLARIVPMRLLGRLAALVAYRVK